jgi:hypothetical protein
MIDHVATVARNDNATCAYDQKSGALYQHETLLHTFFLCAVNALWDQANEVPPVPI